MFSFGRLQLAQNSDGLTLSTTLHNHDNGSDYTICLSVRSSSTEVRYDDQRFKTRMASFRRSLDNSRGVNL